MSSIKSLRENSIKTYTLADALDAPKAKEYPIYYAIELDGVNYAVSKEMIKDNEDNPDFPLKVSRDGQWLVSKSPSSFKLVLETE